MERYDHKAIEKKWQTKWEEDGVYKTGEDRSKPKYYVLDMFPYPSGAGLHIGHVKGYSATDVLARMKRMQGFNVLHPIGWDAFGLPAENYALKNKVHPKIQTEENVSYFKQQLKGLGFSYDWDREINTTDPEYYRWTQWAFIKMWEKGLAYESFEPIIWCPSCQTGLAMEDLEDGKCERCGSEIERKPMRQWVIKITQYADRLLADLDKLPGWEESIKEMQRNWIGKSEGAEIIFQIKNKKEETKNEGVKVFTTRPDTLFGVSYVVLAPEHPLIGELRSDIGNWGEVEEYIEKARAKTDLQRTDLNKDKTGMKLDGVMAINPVNDEKVPVFVADYVLANYGTGAVMAVPAHDQRDYEFARKYSLPMKQVIRPKDCSWDDINKVLKGLKNIKSIADESGVKFWLMGGLACAFHNGVIYRQHGDLDLIVENEVDLSGFGLVLEKAGFLKKGEEVDCEDPSRNHCIYKNDEGLEVGVSLYKHLPDFKTPGLSEEKKKYSDVETLVISREYAEIFKQHQIEKRNLPKDILDKQYFGGKAFEDEGACVNSDFLDGLPTDEAKKKMTEWLEQNEKGKKKVNYKLNDWVFSRQRYWGEPIPFVHCEKCGTVPVSVDELPVKLPDVEHYEPTGTGESPLANITDWVNTTCPKCGGAAKRETNTMPQWAGSSWYYLRYMDPKNDEALVDLAKEKYWSPIDFYVGGAEHATRHLIYARFWHKFLFDIGVVNYEEPFTKLQHVGLVLGTDGRKISKRLNNGANPLDVAAEFGADALRIYENFMGPFGQSCAWGSNGPVGVRRFLDKVWAIANSGFSPESSKEVLNLLHKTIKKVGDDIAEFNLNTAVSAMMIMVNAIDEQGISKEDFSKFIQILSPFAPHLCEEIWHDKLGQQDGVFKTEWPKYDETLMRDEVINLVVQVNGKLRATLKVSPEINEDEAKKVAFENADVKKWVDGKEIVKVVFVPGKLLNFVVR